MSLLRLAALCLAIAFAPLSVQAVPWNVVDLGRLHKPEHCMKAAQLSFRQMLGETRIERLRSSDWITYADGINGQHDALITCAFGDNRGIRATLVMHSASRAIDAHRLTRRLIVVFETHAHEVTEAWKDLYR